MATILFPSNNGSVQGTPGDDSMVGNDPTGNINDIVYGHQGDDTITTQHGLFDSTVYGGQGADVLTDEPIFTASHQVGGNVIYGNFGNDDIFTDNSVGDTFYGGQGDDTLSSHHTTGSVIYGNLGNDVIIGHTDVNTLYYGGHGNDAITLRDDGFNNDVVYGNFGNDVLVARAVDDAVMYGGQGNDFLRVTGHDPADGFNGFTFNDTMFGNLGNDTFAADNGDSGGAAISPDEIVTVADFVQGEDKLTQTTMDGIPLDKIASAGADATDALTAANAFYSTHHAPEYVFVYGGTAAGFLFYNGDGGGAAGAHAHSGMAIVGATGESSVNATDIIPRPGGA